MHYKAMPAIKNPSFEVGLSEVKKKALSVMKAAIKSVELGEKFRLPMYGLIFDNGLQALPHIASMPYQTTILEYPGKDGKRRISVISQQQRGKEDTSTKLNIMSICDHGSGWVIAPFFCQAEINDGINNDKRIKAAFGCFLPEDQNESREEIAEILNVDLHAALALIEALSCTNVESIKTTPRKVNKNAARAGALPFDSYHELMIRPSNKGSNGQVTGLTHRSPREHLRRGHIRRLPAGNVWVNSCVVAAGAGSKIQKSYTVASINHLERKAA